MIRSRLEPLAWLFVLAISLSACGGSSDTPASTAKLDSTYAPAPSLEDAVERFLQAEKDTDRVASFALLVPAARAEYKDVADWTKRRQELPAVTGFRVESRTALGQPALVEHKAELNSFIGLSPGRERQTWKGERFASGWLLEAEPVSEPLYPKEELAGPPVKAWAEAVQACDRPRAESQQAVTPLFGRTTVSLCGVSGPIAVAATGPLLEGAASTEIVAQYTADALTWARVVKVTSPVSLNVVVAPLGEQWRVLGLIE